MKLLYKILIGVLILLAIPLVYSLSSSCDPDTHFCEINKFFVNTGNFENFPLDDVTGKLYVCHEFMCEEITEADLLFTGNSGSSNRLVVPFPNNLQVKAFAEYFFRDGYLPRELIVRRIGTGQQEFNTLFDKAEQCKAEITSLQLSDTSLSQGEELNVTAHVMSPFKDELLVHIPEGYWAYKEIGALWREGITKGCDSNNFCPERNTTRAEVAVLLARALDLSPASQQQIFEDVPSDYWAFNEINTIYKANITKGCSADPLMYCPDRDVSRAELAVFIARALELDVDKFDPQNSATWAADFVDVPSDYWAWKEIQALYEAGITKGCSSSPSQFCPERSATRAEVAVMLARALNLEPYFGDQIFDDVPGFFGFYSADMLVKVQLDGQEIERLETSMLQDTEQDFSFVIDTSGLGVGTHELKLTTEVTDEQCSSQETQQRSATFEIAGTIGNRPPVAEHIPDQTWNKNTVHTLNLNNFFSDPDGDVLTFSSLSVQNINIDIANGVTTLVPEQDFCGQERFTQFAASDGQFNVQSNVVRLTVLCIPTPTQDHDVAVTLIRAPSTIVQGNIAEIKATVENQGAFAETFILTISDAGANEVIATRQVTLESGESEVHSFNWNTTDFALGLHFIEARSSVVQGEQDTADNAKTISVKVLHKEVQPPQEEKENEPDFDVTGIFQDGVLYVKLDNVNRDNKVDVKVFVVNGDTKVLSQDVRLHALSTSWLLFDVGHDFEYILVEVKSQVDDEAHRTYVFNELYNFN